MKILLKRLSEQHLAFIIDWATVIGKKSTKEL